jgi:hypothetical protein
MLEVQYCLDALMPGVYCSYAAPAPAILDRVDTTDINHGRQVSIHRQAPGISSPKT